MSGASVVPPGRRCAAKPAFIHFSELCWDYSDLAGQLGSSCGSAKKMGGEIIIVRTLGSCKKNLVDLPTEKNWGMLIGIINHRLALSTVPNADPPPGDLWRFPDLGPGSPLQIPGACWAHQREVPPPWLHNRLMETPDFADEECHQVLRLCREGFL